MKLHAVLCWWDESPTWLASCVSSLSRIGVSHIIAVDGRYQHFAPGSPPASNIEQSEVIIGTAAACGMGVTLHRPTEARMMEAGKRELSHRIVELTATPHDDWFIVIDGDEYISDVSCDLSAFLAGQPEDVYTVGLRVANTLDPNAEPGADNDVTDKTADIYRNLPVDPTYTSMQSRVWRVLDDMRVGPAHHAYTGSNRVGERIYQRPDIVGGAQSNARTDHDVVTTSDVTIMHRKNWRTNIRRTAKTEYYQLRDELGLERVAT
jgi:hypothetical protein